MVKWADFVAGSGGAQGETMGRPNIDNIPERFKPLFRDIIDSVEDMPVVKGVNPDEYDIGAMWNLIDSPKFRSIVWPKEYTRPWGRTKDSLSDMIPEAGKRIFGGVPYMWGNMKTMTDLDRKIRSDMEKKKYNVYDYRHDQSDMRKWIAENPNYQNLLYSTVTNMTGQAEWDKWLNTYKGYFVPVR